MATKNEEILRKPDWLKIKLNTNENYTGLKKMMREKIYTQFVKKQSVQTYTNVGELAAYSYVYDSRGCLHKSLSILCG